MVEFQVVLVEGLFYDRDGLLHVEQDNGAHVCIQTLLQPMFGVRVQFAMHHFPPQGIQVGQPGAGSCRFLGGQGCPVRHDLHPDRLLAIHQDGVLKTDPWGLTKFDGTTVVLPFSGMPGHFGRVTAATIVDVEKMRDSLASMGPSAFTGMDVTAQDLEVVLARLRKTMGH